MAAPRRESALTRHPSHCALSGAAHTFHQKALGKHTVSGKAAFAQDRHFRAPCAASVMLHPDVNEPVVKLIQTTRREEESSS